MIRGEMKRRQYLRDLTLYGAWHTALFERQKTLPRFESLFEKEKRMTESAHEQTPEQIYEWAIAFTKLVGGKIIKRGTSQHG